MAGSLLPPDDWLTMSCICFSRSWFCSWTSSLGWGQGESVTERGTGGGAGDCGAHLLLCRSFSCSCCWATSAWRALFSAAGRGPRVGIRVSQGTGVRVSQGTGVMVVEGTGLKVT